MTDARVSQVVGEVLAEPTPDRRVSQALAEVLALPDPDRRVSQVLAEILFSRQSPDVDVVATAPSMWLDATTLTGSDGGAVPTWGDVQDKATRATQSTAASQPVYRLSRTPSGGPAVDFAGSKFMTSSDARGSTTQTVIAVVKRAATTVARTLLGSASSAGLQLQLQQSTEVNKLELRAQTTVRLGISTAVMPATWTIVAVQLTSGTGGSWSIRFDRAADSSGSTSQGLSGTSTVIGAHNTASPSSFWNAEIAELITWPRILTGTEVTTVEDYLYDKWFVTAPPTGPTISWWDGDSEETALLEGWWDGSAIQPATAEGQWDGDSIEPLG